LYSILQACQKIKIYFALIFTAIPHNSKCRYGERGAADAVPQPPERCLSRQAGIVRCCLTPQIRSKSILDIPRIIGLSFFSAVFSLITPVFFQAIGAAKVSVAISVMRKIICLIPIFWLLSRLGLGWTWWAFPLSETISGEFGLVLYLRQIHRWPDV
jgi:predicted transporter